MEMTAGSPAPVNPSFEFWRGLRGHGGGGCIHCV